MADPQAFAYVYMDPAHRTDRLAASELWIRMASFRHDTAEVIIQGIDDIDPTRWTTGTPLRITYGRSLAAMGEFVGYLLNINRDWSQVQHATLPRRTAKITAIGASNPLKADLTNIYTGMTSAQIATTLVESHYLDRDIPSTSYVWPSRAASGTSEWSFLCELAKASGLVLYCKGTQVRMYDPLTPLKRNNSVVPYFYEHASGKGSTVLDFRSDVTEMSAEHGRRKRTRILRGMDANTGVPFLATDSGPVHTLATRNLAPSVSESVIDLVAPNQAAATALLPARSVENRFYIRAQARFSGDITVTQASPVVIEGLGTRDSGIWQVLEATHHIRKNWFSTDCELGRDSDYDNGVRPGLPANVARARLDPYATPVLANPPTVLVNGQWRAAWISPTGAPNGN